MGRSLEICRYVKDHDNGCGAEKTILKSPQVVLQGKLIMIMNPGKCQTRVERSDSKPF
jgi:hypothetical protein